MRTIPLDHFKNFLYPGEPGISESGKIAYCLTGVSMEKDCYETKLILRDGESETQAKVFGNPGDFFFIEETLYTLAAADEETRKASENGIPLTTLCTIDGSGNAEPVFTVNRNVSKCFRLSPENWLLLCTDDPLLLSLWKKSGGDREEYLRLKAIEDKYIVAEETPFRSDADGMVNGIRSRLYLYSQTDGSLRLLTPERANVSCVDSKDGLTVFSMAEYDSYVQTKASLWKLEPVSLEPICIDANEYVYIKIETIDAARICCMRSDWALYGDCQNEYLDLVSSDGTLLSRLNGDCEIHVNFGLITDVAYHAVDASIAADCDGVSFLAVERDVANIWHGDFTTGEMKQCAGGSNMTVYDFVYHKGEYISVASKGTDGPELWKFTPGSEPVVLSSFNAALAAEYFVAEPEKFTFTASNGYQINSYLLRPRDFDASKRYPCLFYIHGGPNTAYGANYYHEAQLMACEGYVVLFCNPFGSIGYGAEFSDMRGRYYTQDYDDLTLCIKTGIERFSFIDPDRLGVIGGSYGGMMVNWFITHTDMFKAAVSDRGVADEMTDVFLSDIGFSYTQDVHGGNVWEPDCEDKVLRASAVRYADKVTTPTLFVHGECDYRCSKEQGIIMFAALRYFGVPSRLFIAKGGTHGLSRTGKPQARQRRLEEITRWFFKYLKA